MAHHCNTEHGHRESGTRSKGIFIRAPLATEVVIVFNMLQHHFGELLVSVGRIKVNSVLHQPELKVCLWHLFCSGITRNVIELAFIRNLGRFFLGLVDVVTGAGAFAIRETSGLLEHSLCLFGVGGTSSN